MSELQLTPAGARLALELLTDYIASLPAAEIERVVGTVPPRLLQARDLLKVLWAYGAMETEQRSQAWYQAQLAGLLAELVGEP